jgi:hypothetical protein
MKELFSVMLLAMCLFLITAGTNPLFAADPNQENKVAPPPIEPQPPPAMEGRQTERDEWILERIREIDPQKAEELVQLKDKDPNVFRSEIGKFMRERMASQMSRAMEPKEMSGKPPKGPQNSIKQGPMAPHGPEEFHRRMQEMGEEYMKWLKENYPDEATKLEQIKKENPEQINRAMMLSGMKYGRIYEASKENPQIAQILKEQLSLKEKRANLVRQIKAASDENRKIQFTTDLIKIVDRQFDLIVKHKQLVCEDLAKKLKDLNKELDKKKADIEKWKNPDFKNQKVRERVNELLAESEKFEWE